MSDIAIRVENLSKAYRIGLKEQQHDTLGAALVSWVKSPVKNFKRLRSLSRFDRFDDPDVIWALKDVSFEVKQGEVLGIIGKNGAGKSTLLKLLSRITEPTYGRAEIYGRVASLLEVGTGFNPELTGRENIYLNGTILGMTKKEIDRKLDEIVDFSGVEKFLDTPVKRYSSGMRVRLAFAVAAHLDPEILIIDEVLAVGDVEFQRKCLGKMEDVATKEGRTVLFVSHDMGAINKICQKTIVLNAGEIILKDTSSKATNFYLTNISKLINSNSEFELSLCSDLVFNVNENIDISLKIKAKRKLTERVRCIIVISSVRGECIIHHGVDLYLVNKEEFLIEFLFEQLCLSPANYLLEVKLIRKTKDTPEKLRYAFGPFVINLFEKDEEFKDKVNSLLNPKVKTNVSAT